MNVKMQHGSNETFKLTIKKWCLESGATMDAPFLARISDRH